MNKKHFRLSEKEKRRKVTDTGWFDSNYYTGDEADNIKDPASDRVAHDFHSIPSPLANFHLCADAFNSVAKSGKYEGSSDFHKLISYTLDLWEITFRSPNYPDLSFQSWEIKKEINALKASNVQAHKLLAKTLSLYLLDDDSNPAFKDLDAIHLILYKNDLLGATSPYTGFVPVRYTINHDIKSQSGRFFFKPDVNRAYTPIYKRDEEFIKYLYTICYAFKDYFDPLLRYIQNAKLQQLNEFIPPIAGAFFTAIDNNPPTQEDYYTEYNETMRNGSGQSLMILPGCEVRGIKPQVGKTEFAIKPTRKLKTEKIPLVLRTNPNGKKRIYISGRPWAPTLHVPVYPKDADYTVRRLPENNIEHPYVVATDFLEDDLIELDFPLNLDYFLPEGLKLQGFDTKYPFKYLLPIKSLYFEFFEWGDLVKHLSIECKKIGTTKTILVRLSIPIENAEPIVLEREYDPSNKRTPTERREFQDPDGGIIKLAFNLGLFPYLRVPTQPKLAAPYYIMLTDSEQDIYLEGEFKLKFYGETSIKPGTPFEPKKITHRQKKNSTDFGISIYELDTAFDAVEVNFYYHGRVMKGLIFPRWKDVSINPNKKLHFAFDLGTTNTHIACAEIEGEETRPCNFSPDVPLYVRLDAIPESNKSFEERIENVEYGSNTSHYKSKFAPAVLNGKTNPLPFRTILAQNHTTNHKAFQDFHDLNIWVKFGIDYLDDDKNKYHTNIKWSNDPNNQERLTAFIRQLLLWAKVHTLQQGGQLDQVKIYWLYPLSMETHRINSLKKIWREQSQHIFQSESIGVTEISESEGPYYFNRSQENSNAKQGPMLILDVGGGTVDILLIADPNKPKDSAVTGISCNLGGNELFAKLPGKQVNYLVEYCKGQMAETINQNATLKANFDQITNNKDFEPLDVINFYFKNASTEARFNKVLDSSAEYKLLLLVHYTAIQFYLAQVLKSSGIQNPPANICFSGNASRMLNYLDPGISSNSRDTTLTHFTRVIYELLFSKADAPVKAYTYLHLTKDPKRATAEGALQRKDSNALSKFKPKAYPGEKIYLTTNDPTAKRKIANEATHLGEIDLDLLALQPAKLQELIQTMIELNQKFSFKENFGISLNIKDVFSNRSLIDKAMNYAIGKLSNLKLDKPNEPLAEPVFFYEVRGYLYALTEYLFQSKVQTEANSFSYQSPEDEEEFIPIQIDEEESEQYSLFDETEYDYPEDSIPDKPDTEVPEMQSGFGEIDEYDVFTLVPVEQALYDIIPIEGNPIKGHVVPLASATERLLANNGALLFKIADVENPDDISTATEIEVLTEGLAHLNNKGRWLLNERATVQVN